MRSFRQRDKPRRVQAKTWGGGGVCESVPESSQLSQVRGWTDGRETDVPAGTEGQEKLQKSWDNKEDSLPF